MPYEISVDAGEGIEYQTLPFDRNSEKTALNRRKMYYWPGPGFPSAFYRVHRLLWPIFTPLLLSNFRGCPLAVIIGQSTYPHRYIEAAQWRSVSSCSRLSLPESWDREIEVVSIISVSVPRGRCRSCSCQVQLNPCRIFEESGTSCFL
jgi:hypothetical protein